MGATYRGMTADELPGGWLLDAISGLWAYDTGCVDSGVKDEELRAFVQATVAEWTPEQRRFHLTLILYTLTVSPEALGQGYGWEDARSLADWYDDNFGVG